MVVESWLARAARERPDRPAVGDLSYDTLYRQARAAAAALPRGARVGLALPAGPDFAVALHATLLAGAIAVPIDGRLTAAERPPIDLLVEEPLAARGARGADVRDEHDLESTAVLVHTSGTTGAPKPVPLTYGNWLWNALGSAVALGVDPEERWLCAMPLSHVGGLSILLRSAIYGTSVDLHERFELGRVLAALQSPGGPTIVSLVPTTLARLLDAGLRHPPALRVTLLGGAPIPDALLARAAHVGVPVMPTYGLTETCSQVATDGVPLFCTRLRLADDGEILVSGPTVTSSAGAVLHTGDLGSIDGDGRLRIVGRKADTIVTGGENVAPAEVEAALEAHPAVAEAAVVGRPDPEWGEAVVAIVRLHDGRRAQPVELIEHCAARLARFKVPKDVVIASCALPRTPSGKLLRRELPGRLG